MYAAVCVAFAAMLSGCWSAHEVNDLATINVMGVDSDGRGNVEVTAVVVKPSALFSENISGGTGAHQLSNFIVASASGVNIYEAIGRLSKAITGRMYFGHLDVVIFGEQAAKDSMTDALDYLWRAIDIRPSTRILVAEGEAKPLVKTSPHQKVTLGLEIRDLISSNRYTTAGAVRNLSQFGKAFSAVGDDAYTGIIQPAVRSGIDVMNSPQKGKGQGQGTGGPVGQENGRLSGQSQEQDVPELLSLGGIAVFKKGKMAGVLESPDSNGLLWIKGDMQDEIIALGCEDRSDGAVSLKIKQSKSELAPSLSNGSLAMTVRMQVDADIGQNTCRDFALTSDQFDRLDKQLKELVILQSKTVVRKMQETWQADVFAFGREIWRKYPKTWAQLAPRWGTSGFAELPVTFEVKANVSRAGMLKKSTKAK
jgi:spore germination protein KC